MLGDNKEEDTKDKTKTTTKPTTDYVVSKSSTGVVNKDPNKKKEKLLKPEDDDDSDDDEIYDEAARRKMEIQDLKDKTKQYKTTKVKDIIIQLKKAEEQKKKLESEKQKGSTMADYKLKSAHKGIAEYLNQLKSMGYSDQDIENLKNNEITFIDNDTDKTIVAEKTIMDESILADINKDESLVSKNQMDELILEDINKDESLVSKKQMGEVGVKSKMDVVKKNKKIINGFKKKLKNFFQK